MSLFRRLDHILIYLPDTERAHQACRDAGLAEAWPPGQYWPTRISSGVSVGPYNVEFITDSEEPAERPEGRMIVFEPSDIGAAEAWLAGRGCPLSRNVKMLDERSQRELRGFVGADLDQSQELCTYSVPNVPTPFPFFVCQYTPYQENLLRGRRGPDLTDGAELCVRVQDPDAAARFLESMAVEAGTKIRFVKWDKPGIDLESVPIVGDVLRRIWPD